jgi:hypothetical protein
MEYSARRQLTSYPPLRALYPTAAGVGSEPPHLCGLVGTARLSCLPGDACVPPPNVTAKNELAHATAKRKKLPMGRGPEAVARCAT